MISLPYVLSALKLAWYVVNNEVQPFELNEDCLLDTIVVLLSSINIHDGYPAVYIINIYLIK